MKQKVYKHNLNLKIDASNRVFVMLENDRMREQKIFFFFQKEENIVNKSEQSAINQNKLSFSASGAIFCIIIRL